jgi:hypothetical protein
MSFYFGNKEVTNPIAKVLLAIFAIVIVVLVMGFVVGFILPSIAFILLGVMVFVALIVPIAMVFGLGKWMKGIRGSGNFLTEIRDVQDYKDIKIAIPCNFVIENSANKEIEITADDNLLGYILTYVQDGTLYITTNNSLSPSKTIILTMKSLGYEKLAISGTAKGEIKSLKQDKLDIKISGTGTVKGSGKVDKLSIGVSGVGKVYFKELKCEDAVLRLSGTGKAELFVTKSIDATISGTGKADVYGKPEDVKRKVNGVGKINII